jgi:2-polyprenyl-3-methyl-5-hydroxy-6-metoxy-1,4-benzoquinol methylase
MHRVVAWPTTYQKKSKMIEKITELAREKFTGAKTDTWSLGDLVHLGFCPCCRAPRNNNDTHYSRRDDNQTFSDIWNYYRCSSCRSIYLDPRPDDKSLPKAYKNYYTHDSKNTYEDLRNDRILDKLVNGYLNYRFKMQRQPSTALGALSFILFRPLGMKLDTYGRHIKKKSCHPNTQLLDIGCGNGDFISIANEMGISATGCDTDSKAIDHCHSRGLSAIHGDADDARVKNSSYDVITLNHVIEHVNDPIYLLRRAYSILKPGGHIWIALPNPCAFGLKIFGPSWRGLHPPFHLMIPSQSILINWTHEAGFYDAHLRLRGVQSPAMWRDSMRIYCRDNGKQNNRLISQAKYAGDVLSSIFPYWGEEIILIARKAPFPK